MSETMKAIVRDAYGSTDVLRLEEVAKPVAAEGEVLVRVLAAGVDQGAWHLMVGMPYVMRAEDPVTRIRRGRPRRSRRPERRPLSAWGRSTRDLPGLIRRVRGRPR
jgi:hypothetical protein